MSVSGCETCDTIREDLGAIGVRSRSCELGPEVGGQARVGCYVWIGGECLRLGTGAAEEKLPPPPKVLTGKRYRFRERLQA